jgi:S1-C subfamily serine protease
VTSVETGTAAEAARLFIGDILVELAGAALRRPDDLLATLAEQEIGAEVTLKLVRGGQLTSLPVKVGERPAASE